MWAVSSQSRLLGLRMTSSARPPWAWTVSVLMWSLGVGPSPLSTWFLRGDPASSESWFGWILHRHDPRHYHLFFLGCPDSVANTYFFPPIRNLSPTYAIALSLGPFPRVGHVPWRPILFGVFNTTLLQGQIVPPPICTPSPHVFSVFAPARCTPEKTLWIHSRHGLQNVF